MPRDPATLDLRKKPQQSRSHDTYFVILQAASEILATSGLSQFNTNVVAKRAGVSVGSLYQYFASKEAILAALIREMRQDMLTEFQSAIQQSSDLGLPVAISALIEASLKHHLDDPTLTQLLEQVEDELPLNAETQALKEEMMQLVVELLIRHDIAEPNQTAFDLVALSHGIAQAATQDGQTDFDNLALRLKRAALGYLDLPRSSWQQ